MTSARFHQEAGFTLVETLIAVFALALMMGAGTTMVLSALKGQSILSERTDQIEAIDLFSAHLRGDLEAAVPRLVQSERSGEGLLSLHGGDDARNGIVLGLVRNGWSNFDNVEDRSELLAVEYLYEEGRLVRRVFQRPDRARATPRFETEMLTGLRDLRIRFYAGGQPADLWRLAVSNGEPAMPDAVEITLAFETDETLTQRFLVGGRS